MRVNPTFRLYVQELAKLKVRYRPMASAILVAPGWVCVGITAPARHIRHDAAQELARSVAEALMDAQQGPDKCEQPELGLWHGRLDA